jgi:hypothetical protein
MKEKLKDTYKAESGKGFFLMVSKQDQKVKERYCNYFFAFPSKKTNKNNSLIKNHHIKTPKYHYNGISIKNQKKKGKKCSGYLNPLLVILNRAEAVMAQFFTIFSVSKKVVIYPELNKGQNENGKSQTTI